MHLISLLSFWAFTCVPLNAANPNTSPLPELLTFEELMVMTPAEQTKYMYEFGKLLVLLENANAKYELAGIDTRSTKELIARAIREFALIGEAQADDGPESTPDAKPDSEKLKPQGPSAFTPIPAKDSPSTNFTPRPAGGPAVVESTDAPTPGRPTVTPLSSALTNFPTQPKGPKGRGRRGRAGGLGPGGSPIAGPAANDAPAAAAVIPPAATPAGTPPAATPVVPEEKPAVTDAKTPADDGPACVPTKTRAEHQALLDKYKKDKSNGDCIRGGFFSKYDKGAYRYGGCKAPVPPKEFAVDGKTHHLKTTCPTSGESMCNPSVFCAGYKSTGNGGTPAFRAGIVCAKVDSHFTRNCQTALDKSLGLPFKAKKKSPTSLPKGYENSKSELCPRDFAGIKIADYYRSLFADTQKSYNELCVGNKNFKALFCEECGIIGPHLKGMVAPFVAKHERIPPAAARPAQPAAVPQGGPRPPPGHTTPDATQ